MSHLFVLPTFNSAPDDADVLPPAVTTTAAEPVGPPVIVHVTDRSPLSRSAVHDLPPTDTEVAHFSAQPTMSHSAHIASTCLTWHNVAVLCRKRHVQQYSYAEPST